MNINIRKGYDGAYGDISAEFDAPALTGSDKQIAWASDIRTKAITGALRRLVESPARARATADAIAATPEEFSAFKGQLQAILTGATSAKEWIDTRGDVRALAAKYAVKP